MCWRLSRYRSWVSAGQRHDLVLAPGSQVFSGSLVYFALDIHCLGSRTCYRLGSVQYDRWFPCILQGVPYEYWLHDVQDSFVVTSFRVIEFGLLLLSFLVCFLVEVIIEVFRFQGTSGTWEGGLRFVSK